MIKSFDFFFDFISPYSYLAHKQIRKIEKENSNAGSNALNELSRFSMFLAPVDNKWGCKSRLRIFGLEFWSGFC